MLRKFDSDIFSDCRTNLGKEMTELGNISQYLSTASLHNYQSSEFADGTISSTYSQISSTISGYKTNNTNHQIYLGKRSSYLNDDDTNAANSLLDVLAGLEGTISSLDSVASEASSCCNSIATDGVTINSLLTPEEVQFIEHGLEGYDPSVLLLPDNDPTKQEFINACFEYSLLLVSVGLIPNDVDEEIRIPIGQGVWFYFSVSLEAGIESDVPVEVDVEGQSISAPIASTQNSSINLCLDAGKIGMSSTLEGANGLEVEARVLTNYFQTNIEYTVSNSATVSINGVPIEGSSSCTFGLEYDRNQMLSPEMVPRLSPSVNLVDDLLVPYVVDISNIVYHPVQSAIHYYDIMTDPNAAMYERVCSGVVLGGMVTIAGVATYGVGVAVASSEAAAAAVTAIGSTAAEVGTAITEGVAAIGTGVLAVGSGLLEEATQVASAFSQWVANPSLSFL